MQLTQQTKKLIANYQLWQKSLQPKADTPTLHVDEVASRVAAFYEKIRDIVDWKEEHLIRRMAIIRKLKRRFLNMELENVSGSKEVARSLVLELIRGGHFSNDRIEEGKVDEVQKVLEKYIYILKNRSLKNRKRNVAHLQTWIWEVASCEIEEILGPSIKEISLINYMFELMKERIRVNEGIIKFGGLTEEQINIQIYIAVQKALFKLDPSIIAYQLLKYKYSWWKNPDQKQLEKAASEIYIIWKKSENEMTNPIGERFYQVCEKYDTPYLLLGDIISSEPEDIEAKIQEPQFLESQVRENYKKRLKTSKARMARAALYATVSIFITKIALAMALEIPLDKYITHNFNMFALAVNVIFPPLLMFLLVATVKLPRRENLERVVLETMKIVYTREGKDVYEIKAMPRGSIALNIFITLLYMLSFVFSFGVISWLLYKLGFPYFSILIFLIFISLIAFAGTKIRKRSKELQIIEEKESFSNTLGDLFSVPIVEVGKWLIGRWQKYNIIATFFNALIDMPFFTFVKFLEQWRYFLKEKKEKIH